MSNTKDTIKNFSEAKDLDQIDLGKTAGELDAKTYEITSLETLYIVESLRFGYNNKDVPDSYIKFDKKDRMRNIYRVEDTKHMQLNGMIKLPSKIGHDIAGLLMGFRANSKSVDLQLEVENNEVVDFGYQLLHEN